ncbi:uncharacterized protein LOC115210845 [Argonauta hians]
MTTGEERNKCDLLCGKCSKVILTENVAKIQHSITPKYFDDDDDIPSEKLKSDISTEYREGYDSCNFFEVNIHKLIKFKEIAPKPKKDDFDLHNCSIDELENKDFMTRVKECWVTENIYDCQNISAICVDTNRREKNGPVFCVECKIKIGWSNGYNCLKPVYILKEMVKEKQK